MENNGNYREKLGQLGEDETVAYLVKHGHSILERNWRSGHLEVDVISLATDGVHFVEVKSRKSDEAVNPEDSVGEKKIKRIASAAARYIRQRKIEVECHFDVAAVVFGESGTELKYVVDAYLPIYV